MLTVKTLLRKNLISPDLIVFSKQVFPDFTILVISVLATQSELVQICSEGLCMWEVTFVRMSQACLFERCV